MTRATSSAGAGRALVFVVTILLALSFARRARAENAEITASVESDVVEVGQTFTYTQKAMVHGGGAPSDAKPGSLAGFTLLGANDAPVHMRTLINGVLDEVNGLVTSWTLRAERVGTFTLGPSQIVVDDTRSRTRRSGPAVRIKVVPRGAGGAAKPQARTPFDPFGASPLDPFKGLFDFGTDDRRDSVLEPSADPKFAMDAPRAPVAFLHATIDKSRAVVGEQITLSVYLYEDPYARQGRPGDVHEATASDFVKRSLLEDETRAVGVGTARVGGKLWSVKLVRKNALFPLKTGHLVIEPMSMTLAQARVGLRASEALAVDVGEPPLAGRPAGYAIGDVGEMSLQASVSPRATIREGALGVIVELRGTGNLPGQLTLPIVPGVEWLEPQTRDKLGAMQADRFGGTRTFSYVVRLHKEGPVDLGEVRLPYYDADKRTYGVARAALGIVNVSPGASRDAGASDVEIVLAGMPKERRVLEGPRAESYLSERPIYWAALFGSPLACVLALGAHGLFGRLRKHRANATKPREQIARDRRAEADRAVRGDDGKSAMGAVARAIESELLAKTGVNVRGAASDQAPRELEEAGVDPAKARDVVAVLRACEDARFSPGGITVEAAREIWSRARELLDGLQVTRSKRT